MSAEYFPSARKEKLNSNGLMYFVSVLRTAVFACGPFMTARNHLLPFLLANAANLPISLWGRTIVSSQTGSIDLIMSTAELSSMFWGCSEKISSGEVSITAVATWWQEVVFLFLGPKERGV